MRKATFDETSNRLDMEILKRKAILVHDGMETYFPQFSTREELHISELHPQSLTYAYNNSVIAFVDEHNDFYVIPALKDAQKILVNNGYTKNYFYVPFSNWDYPVARKEDWENLWREKNAEM